MDLYVNLSIEILYQYEYVAQLQILNYGIIATFLDSAIHISASLRRNKSEVSTEMTSREH